MGWVWRRVGGGLGDWRVLYCAVCIRAGVCRASGRRRGGMVARMTVMTFSLGVTWAAGCGEGGGGREARFCGVECSILSIL